MPLPNVDDLPLGDEPIIVWGTIIRDKTLDGVITLSDQKYLHQRIAFNARTRATYTMKTKMPNEKWMFSQREVIFKIDEPTEWLPIELIDFEE